MKYPTPKGPGLADRAKDDLKQTAEQGKRWFQRYGDGRYQLFWVYGSVAVIGLLYGVYWVGQQFRMEVLGGKEELAKARATAVVEWKKGAIGAAVPFDVNADGQLDVIGTFKGLDPDGDYVGAFDGKTGKQFWRYAAPKLNFSESLTLIGQQVLLTAPGNEVRLIDAKTGKLSVSAKMPHAIREVCPGPDAQAFVIRNYRQYSKVSTSNLAVATDEGAWCSKKTVEGVGVELDQVPALPGLIQGAALLSGDVTLVSGKQNDKLVVVALDPQAKELWRREFATPKQFAAIARAESGGTLYAIDSYGKPPTLHAIDVKTGKDKWSTSKLAKLGFAFVVRASSDAVYVTTDGMLHVVDAKTGAPRFSLGEQASP